MRDGLRSLCLSHVRRANRVRDEIRQWRRCGPPLCVDSDHHVTYLQYTFLFLNAVLYACGCQEERGLRREGEREFGSAGDYDSGMDVMYGTAQGTAVSIL